jgi:hypothetical protein
VDATVMTRVAPGASRAAAGSIGRLTGTAFAAIVCLAGTISAHQLGQTQVVATFVGGRTYVIDVTVDPDALLPKLEALSGSTVSGELDAAERARRIRNLQAEFLNRISIAFDDARVIPDFEYITAPRASSDATARPDVVRLMGTIPHDARTFTWSSSLVYGSYVVELHKGSDKPVTMWVNGREESAPFDLGGRPVPHARAEALLLGLFVVALVVGVRKKAVARRL